NDCDSHDCHPLVRCELDFQASIEDRKARDSPVLSQAMTGHSANDATRDAARPSTFACSRGGNGSSALECRRTAPWITTASARGSTIGRVRDSSTPVSSTRPQARCSRKYSEVTSSRNVSASEYAAWKTTLEGNVPSTSTVITPAKVSARRLIIRKTRHMPVADRTILSVPATTPYDSVVTVIRARTSSGKRG